MPNSYESQAINSFGCSVSEAIEKVKFNLVTMTRGKDFTLEPTMGNLPSSNVMTVEASRVGVDPQKFKVVFSGNSHAGAKRTDITVILPAANKAEEARAILDGITKDLPGPPQIVDLSKVAEEFATS